MSIFIWAYFNGRPLQVDMPSATTAAHAALRVAEAMGLSPDDGPYSIGVAQGPPIPNDAIMAHWHGAQVVLFRQRRR